MRHARDGNAELALELTHLAVSELLVDIGCGPGVAARLAAARGATVTGVDPEDVMLRMARHDDRTGTVRWQVGSAEALPLEDASCDVAWTLSSVHHWRDLGASLNEVGRVLRDGGRFLATERRVAPGATGHASHGWTEQQAETFAELCADAGFVDTAVTTHRVGRRQILAVLAHRATR
jgi:ubiquinone/menaquinone biosynthesis C-methylase UbiE